MEAGVPVEERKRSGRKAKAWTGADGCRGDEDGIDDALVIVWADEPRQFPEHTDGSGECIHRLSPTK